MFQKKIDNTTFEVLKNSFSSTSIKIFGMLTAFGVSVFLGRTIGPSGLGTINLANQIALVCSVFAMFGMQHVLIKRVAIANERKQLLATRNSIGASLLFNGFLALVFSLIGILLAESLAINVFKDLSLKTPLIIFFASLLPLTISRVLIYSLNGIKKIWQSNLLDQVLSITIVALILLAGLIFQFDLSVDKVAQYYLFARALVLIITVIYWKKQFQFSISFNYKPELKNMLTMAFPLLLVSSTSIIASNADTIMIGWLMDTKNVGLYSVAAKIALLTSFILQVTNSAVSPRLAYMFDENKIEETQRMVKQVSFFLAVIAIGFMVTAFFLGEFALSLWGMEFVTAYYPLLILCAGQFFNISTGCAGLLLVMCGHEKILGKISVISLLMNLGLNIILIKHYGIIGAAIATAGVITVENIMKVIIAKRKTGILSIPFSW